jgi:hypothetical protein
MRRKAGKEERRKGGREEGMEEGRQGGREEGRKKGRKKQTEAMRKKLKAGNWGNSFYVPAKIASFSFSPHGAILGYLGF